VNGGFGTTQAIQLPLELICYHLVSHASQLPEELRLLFKENIQLVFGRPFLVA